MDQNQPIAKTHWYASRRFLRWAVVAVLAALGLWAATWLMERSLRSPGKKRAMQAWLDTTLNADVSKIDDMVVRLNLVRKSRLVFSNVEIEHPNPLFSGKLAVVRRMAAWSPPWAVAGVWPGELDLLFERPVLTFEEGEGGEWSCDGLLRPLTPPDKPFPFPVPRISAIDAEIDEAGVTIRRRGNELELGVHGELFGRAGSGAATLRAEQRPFTFRPAGAEAAVEGTFGPAVVRLRTAPDSPIGLRPVPGACEAKVAGLPLSILPLLVKGIPLDGVQGTFSGTLEYRERPDAKGVVYLEGTLTDAPLSVFGLPRQAPVQVEWPASPAHDGVEGRVRMGPSGFGAFEIHVPLDTEGRPRLLSMRGDVAALDGVPALFTRHSRWSDWLSRTFPGIEWTAGSWLGFGWSGTDMKLRLFRSTGGLNLSGEGTMMGGRIRIAMTPDQHDAPIAIAAEKLDAELMAVKLRQMLPEAFHAQLTGTHVNFTWRGFRSEDGEIGQWGAGFVFAKPVVDLAASGEWWRGLSGVAWALIGALPEWGGGDDTELRDFAGQTVIRFDQLSIVSEGEPNGESAVEFRAYGEAVGQATGMIEKRVGGLVEGEFLLAGPSAVLDVAEKANPDFGLALKLLATDSMGLRITFRLEPGKVPVFAFPFLEDARRLHRELLKNGATPP